MGFKGVQPLQRVNQSNLLAVLTVMSGLDPHMINLFEVDNKSELLKVAVLMIIC